MRIVESERLSLRQLELTDAEFILRLLNEASFLDNIGDRGVRDLEGAREYLRNGPLRSYEENGFGLWCVERHDGGAAVGICGLLQREALEDVDVGYALLPEFWSHGYATEAAAAAMAYGQDRLGLRRLVAIVALHNEPSIRVLEKLGFRFERRMRFGGADSEEVALYGWVSASG